MFRNLAAAVLGLGMMFGIPALSPEVGGLSLPRAEAGLRDHLRREKRHLERRIHREKHHEHRLKERIHRQEHHVQRLRHELRGKT